MMLGTKLKIATLNTRGANNTGAINEGERGTKASFIKILALQETRVAQNIGESRKQYTRCFSGEGGRKEYTAGVAIIVENSYLQYIEDIEPISDRLMYITLRGTMPTTIIAAYMSAADRPYEEKSEAYAQLQSIVDKKKSKGPKYITGDWNARLILPKTHTEEEIIGKHTMHTGSITLDHFAESMTENRDLFIGFCAANELKVTNTMFRKPLDEAATYRKHKDAEDIINEPITTDTHEQLDSTLTIKRWKTQPRTKNQRQKQTKTHFATLLQTQYKSNFLGQINRRRKKQIREMNEEQQETLNNAVQETQNTTTQTTKYHNKLQ